MRSRHDRLRRRSRRLGLLGVTVFVLFAMSLMLGDTLYSPREVLSVLTGADLPGASFVIGELRLPRAALALIAGASLGLAGITFQTMLRNPLAAPDIIGIDSGAATAAVAGIVLWSLDDTPISALALAGALATAATIYALAHRNGFAGTRLILIGIGVAAFLRAITQQLLSRAAEWDIQTALQWMVGSLNGATWASTRPLAITFLIVAPLLLLRGRDLEVLRLGDDTAAALGLRVNRTRVLLLISAVALLAFTTAACGPIAFVAFMSGPLAARLIGVAGSQLLPSALTGSTLVLAADLIGANLLGHRLPVGVVTGALGAPFLLFLLARTTRAGGLS